MEEIKKEDEEALKAKSRNVSIVEGSAYSVMDGFGLRYITPYAVALGMSNFFIALLSSFPALFSSLAGIPGSKIIEKKSRKTLVSTSAFLQALSWIPLLAVGYLYFFHKMQTLHASLLIILFYTILTSLGAFAGPAWNSWMRDLVSEKTDSYFGRRNGVVGAVVLISTFLSGLILSYLKNKGAFYGFLVIFSIAFVGRAISAYLFTKQYEPQMKTSKENYFSLLDFIKKMFHNNFGIFVLFSTLISFAVAIASPFFAVYLLKDLNFSYFSYTIIMSISIITTFVCLPYWGKFGDKYGDVRVLRICGSFIFLVPLLWIPTILFISNFKALIIYLVIIEIFSGIIWSGFNLSTSTFVFQAVSKEKLPLCIAYSTILNSIGIFIGASLGGFLSSIKTHILIFDNILFVFLISGVLRFILFIAFIGKIKEVRPIENLEMRKLKFILTRLWPRQLFGHHGINRTGHIN